MISHTIEIDAPARTVWALNTDVARWPELLPATVQAVEPAQDHLGPGATARIKQPAQPWRTWTVTAFEPEQRFVWEADGFGGRIIARHTQRPDGAHTVNTLSIELTGRAARLRERLFHWPIARALRIENTAFKQEAERVVTPEARVG